MLINVIYTFESNEITTHLSNIYLNNFETQQKEKAPRRITRLGVVNSYSTLFHMFGEVIMQPSTTRINATIASTNINAILPVSESSLSSQV